MLSQSPFESYSFRLSQTVEAKLGGRGTGSKGFHGKKKKKGNLILLGFSAGRKKKNGITLAPLQEQRKQRNGGKNKQIKKRSP